MHTNTIFRPSDALVIEFRRIYHGGLLDRIQHWYFRSHLSHEDVQDELTQRVHDALLARFWPWSGDIAKPVMGYPDGDDIRVLWNEEEREKMLTTFNWALSGLIREDNRVGERMTIARKLLDELFRVLVVGETLYLDRAKLSFSGGYLIACVTSQFHKQSTTAE